LDVAAAVSDDRGADDRVSDFSQHLRSPRHPLPARSTRIFRGCLG
jgi:hypothetical protein